MKTFLQDLRYGARMLLKQKGLSLIAILSLALGIGANTALFSVIDALLLRRLPVQEPQSLVLLRSLSSREFSPGSYTGNSGPDPVTGLFRGTSFDYQTFLRLRDQKAGRFTDVMAFGDVGVNLSVGGQAEVIAAQAVSGNYFQVLGVRPLAGRTLTDDDDKASASPVAVISYRYWQQRFGGAVDVVGSQVNLNNIAFKVVGVTPPGFDGTMQAGSTQDVTVSIAWEPALSPGRSRMG